MNPLESSCEASELVDALGTRHRPVAAVDARIISLVPSLTELLFALGLGAQVVGRTGFCIHPRDQVRALPKVGGTKDVKLDRVRELEPTHVVLNIDENTQETADALAAFVPNLVVTHPCTPEDNLALFALFGRLFGREQAADALASELRGALAEAARVRAECSPEKVAYLIWRKPWMTVSRQTYIAAMLATVGWLSLPEDGQVRYPVFDWGADWLDGVERVFLSSEPYRFDARHVDEVRSLSGKPTALIDGEMVSWYGSRAVAGVRYLSALRCNRQMVG